MNNSFDKIYNFKEIYLINYALSDKREYFPAIKDTIVVYTASK